MMLGRSSKFQLPVSHVITRLSINTLKIILYLYSHFAFHFQNSITGDNQHFIIKQALCYITWFCLKEARLNYNIMLSKLGPHMFELQHFQVMAGLSGHNSVRWGRSVLKQRFSSKDSWRNILKCRSFGSLLLPIWQMGTSVQCRLHLRHNGEGLHVPVGDHRWQIQWHNQGWELETCVQWKAHLHLPGTRSHNIRWADAGAG